MRSLTWEQVHRRRLARAFLAKPAARARLVDVVRACRGIHAQILTAAEFSLGIRVEEQIRGQRLEIRVQPFRRLTASQRESLAASVERIGTFLSAEATLSLG